MVALFDGNLSTTIISCYNPTNASDETDLITVYNELSSFVAFPNSMFQSLVEIWMLK